MRTTSISIVASVSLALLIPGCTFVSLQTDASHVARIEAPAAPDCEELGITRVEVLHEVGFLTRNPSKVEGELDILARNAAVDLGGNTVVPSGPVEAGKRAYRVLRCP